MTVLDIYGTDNAGFIDTWINAGNTSLNYGTGSYLAVGEPNDAGGADARALIKFDTSAIGAGSTCTAATLRLMQYVDKSSTARTLKVYRMVRYWAETGATWSRAETSPVVAWGTAGASASSDAELTDIGTHAMGATESSGTYHSISLTPSAVQDWWDGGLTNNGILLRYDVAVSNDQHQFYSSEYGGDYGPRLTVDYTGPVASSTCVIAEAPSQAFASVKAGAIDVNIVLSEAVSEGFPGEPGALDITTVLAEAISEAFSDILSGSSADAPLSEALSEMFAPTSFGNTSVIFEAAEAISESNAVEPGYIDIYGITAETSSEALSDVQGASDASYAPTSEATSDAPSFLVSTNLSIFIPVAEAPSEAIAAKPGQRTIRIASSEAVSLAFTNVKSSSTASFAPTTDAISEAFAPQAISYIDFDVDTSLAGNGIFIITADGFPFTLYRDGVEIASGHTVWYDMPPNEGIVGYAIKGVDTPSTQYGISATQQISVVSAPTIYYLTNEDEASDMDTDLLDQFNTLIGGQQEICDDGIVNLRLRRNNQVIAEAIPLEVTESGVYMMTVSIPVIAVGAAQSLYVDVYGTGYPAHAFRLISSNLTYLETDWIFRLIILKSASTYFLSYGQSGDDYESAMRGLVVSAVPLPQAPTLTYVSNLVTGALTLKASYNAIATGYRFYKDDQIIADQVGTQFVTTMDHGMHLYEASAYNTVGESDRSSPPILVTLSEPLAPSLILGSYNLATGGIVLTATTAEVVEGVHFYRDGVKIGSGTASTPSFTDNVKVPGAYTYTAKTYNYGGISEASNSEVLTVSVPSQPSVTLSDFNYQNGMVAITVTPNDERTIGYKFYRDGVLISTQSARTYTDTLNVAGTYTYTAKAYNVAGDSVVSAGVPLTVLTPIELNFIAAFDTKTGAVLISAASAHAIQYTFYRNGSSIGSNSTGMFSDSVEVAGLYTYNVSATNHLGTTNGEAQAVEVSWVGRLRALHEESELKLGVKAYALSATSKLKEVNTLEFICSEFGLTSEPVVLTMYPPFEGSSDGIDFSDQVSIGVVDSLTRVPFYYRELDYVTDAEEQPMPLADISYGTVGYHADISQVLDLIVTGGLQTLDISWSPATNAHFYEIQYRIGTAEWVSIQGVYATSYTISGLSDGTTYEVQVRGLNEASGGAWSVSKTAVTVQPTPTWQNVYSTGFESDTVGSVAAGWTGTWSVKPVGLTGSTQSFGATIATQNASYILPTPITNRIRCSYTTKTGSSLAGTGRWGTFWTGGTTTDVGIAGTNKQITGVAIIGSNFQVAYNIGGAFAWRTLFAASTDTEYKVTIEIDLLVKRWWVTVEINGGSPTTYGGVEGYPAGSNNPAGNTFSALTHFNVAAQAIQAGGTIYVDNVSIDKHQG